MNNPLKFTDPIGLLTQDEYDQILWELLTSDHGGYWKPGMSSPYLFIDGEEAGAAGQQYMSEHGYGGGGSWRPVYNLSVETSGRLGGFVQTGLIGGPKFRWRHGNFQISFYSEIVGWRWVSSEESIFTIVFFSVDAFEVMDALEGVLVRSDFTVIRSANEFKFWKDISGGLTLSGLYWEFFSPRLNGVIKLINLRNGVRLDWKIKIWKVLARLLIISIIVFLLFRLEFNYISIITCMSINAIVLIINYISTRNKIIDLIYLLKRDLQSRDN